MKHLVFFKFSSIRGIAISSGIFLHDDDGGRVLVCGGYQCPEPDVPGGTPNCYQANYYSISHKENISFFKKNVFLLQAAECYTWNPRDNAWTLDSTMLNERWEHLMAAVICLGNKS